MSRNRDRIYHYNYFDTETAVFNQLSIFDIDLTEWEISRRYFSDKAELKDHELVLSQYWYRDFEQGVPSGFEKKDVMEFPVEEEKDYFLKEWKEPDQLSFGELRQYIHQIDESGFETTSFKVDLNFKVSFPFACLIVALLGIPFAFKMGKRGALVGIGLSIVIAMVYWGAIGIFRSLGYANYLNAFLAAWGPNLIFGLAGLYLFFTLKK